LSSPVQPEPQSVTVDERQWEDIRVTAPKPACRHGLGRTVALGILTVIAIATTPSPATPPPPPSASPPKPANVDALVKEALAAEARMDVKTALTLFRKARSQAESAFVLQKVSKQCSDLSEEVTDSAEKLRLCREGLSCSQRAVTLEPKNAVNVLSVAICYGKLALLSDIRTRIAYSRRMKEYVDQALVLDPNYAYAHHVLGRWNTAIVTLGATKRLLVQVIYGRLPEGSLTEAIQHLRRAVALAPQVPSHYVELGFALLADDQRAAARAAFEQALTLPPRERYDLQELRRARIALAGWR
jgi:tetratricopeptide (TPR) repeat protein